ncbi:MAG: biotin/lipoyl-binding protein [Desulfohalobiaceae bacterium]|nr:biotin/lipoyl-binding protein [Desulfohalobiaceae bacterium]
MKRYRITVEGKTYEVEVEELENDETGPSVSGKPAPRPEAGPARPRTGSSPASATPAAPSAAGEAAAPSQGPGEVTAPMAGKVVSINVKPGDRIARDDVLLILEAMKMENEIRAQGDGKVTEIIVSEGSSVNNGDLLLKIENRYLREE